jgi:phage gpG-like protein
LGVRGDFSGLTDLRRRIAAFEDGRVMRRISKACAEEARTQVSESFERGVDPYDNPWAPLTSRTGEPLRDTGRFMNSFTATSERDFFTVSTNFVGAAVHQYGATIKPKIADALFFEVEGGFRIAGARGKRLKKPRAFISWIMTKKVTIPRRQYIPEGRESSRWSHAIEAAVDLVVHHELQRLGVAY